MEFIIHLLVIHKIQDAILTIVKQFTKYVQFIPCMTSIDAEATDHLFFPNGFANLGCEFKVLSDLDPSFMNLF